MPLHAIVPLNTPPELRALAEDVLSAVASARFVSVGSVMAYGGPYGLSLELLEGWCKAGLLHRGRVQPDLLRPDAIDYLALTTSGARALYAATGRRVEAITAPRLKRSSQKRMHDVWAGELALTVLTLAKEGRIDLVGLTTDDRKLASVVHVAEVGREPERIVLQPDALIVTKGRLGTEALLVEVDRASVAPRRMQARYAGFLAWHRDGGPFRDYGTKALRIVTLVPSEARLEKLHAVAVEASRGKRSGLLAFGLLDDFTVCTAERWLEPTARTLGAGPEDKVPLLTPAPTARAA